MNIQKIQNIGFKGFTNIIALHNAPIDDKYISFISAKLDNNGNADLDWLQDICKMKNLQAESNDNKDVLTLVYTYDTTKNKDSLYFQDKLLYWGDELREFSEKQTNKMMSDEDYKSIQKFHMKAYTFLANITERMSYSEFNNEDEKMARVIRNLYSSLFKAVKCEQGAFYLLRAGCMKINHFKKVSGDFHKVIIDTMEKFFR